MTKPAERERIARIIDPNGWEYYDLFKHQKGGADLGPHVATSLDKADEILGRSPAAGLAYLLDRQISGIGKGTRVEAFNAGLEAAAKAVEAQIPAPAGFATSHTNTARVVLFDAVKAIRVISSNRSYSAAVSILTSIAYDYGPDFTEDDAVSMHNAARQFFEPQEALR